MISYRYEALSANGQKTKGEIQAATVEQAERKLEQQNLVPLFVIEGGANSSSTPKASSLNFSFGKRKASLDDIVDMLRSLQVMIRSGINIVEALETIGEHSASEAIKDIANRIRNEVLEGQTLDRAMRKIPEAFPEVVCEMMAVADEGGHLAKSIESAIQYLGYQAKTRKIVGGALVYPIALLGISVVTLLLFMIVILPTFGQTFDGLNVKLPFITAFLLKAGQILKENVGALLIGTIVFGVGLKFAVRIPQVKLFLNAASYKIPIFGKVLRELALARSISTFGSLMETNIPIITAVEFSGKVAGYGPLVKAFETVADRVQNGDTIADSMGKTGAFPAMTVQLVSVGEKSGQLAELLLTASSQTQEAAERKMKSVLSLLEPAFILVMGGIVGALVLSILMPLFSLNQSIQ
jgi:type II secretory pathway component PulF